MDNRAPLVTSLGLETGFYVNTQLAKFVPLTRLA
jgi:hypothetical protein